MEWVFDHELTRAYEAGVSTPDGDQRLRPWTVNGFVTALAAHPAGVAPLRHRPGGSPR